MSEQLEQLYQQAKSALKDRDYVRASELLRQILQIDKNYKDASRLLAQMVKLRRMRWYNHPLLRGGLGLTALIVLGIWLAPLVRDFYASQVVLPTGSPTATMRPTAMLRPTQTPKSTPTPIPLAWKRISIGQEFPRDTIVSALIDENDLEVMYVGTKNAGIYKSIDGGISWQPESNSIIRSQLASRTRVFTFPDYDTSSPGIAISTEQGKIYRYRISNFAGGEVLELSKDGKIWEWHRLGCTYLFKDTPNQAYVFCDGRLYVLPGLSQVGTKIPTEMTHPLAIAVALQSQDVILVGGQEGLFITKNRGATWQNQTNGLGNTIMELKISQNGIFFAQDSHTMSSRSGSALEACNLYRSMDRGQSWTTILRGTRSSCGLSFDADGSTLYWNDFGNFVHRSADNGDTWESWGGFRQSDSGKFQMGIIVPHPKNNAFVYILNENKLYVTLDEQKTWFKPIAGEWPVPMARLYFDHNEGSEIYLVFSDEGRDGGVYHSTDYGKSWFECSEILTSSPTLSDTQLVIDPRDSKKILLALWDYGGIIASRDGCQSWFSSYTGIGHQRVNTIAIDINNPDRVLAGTNDGAYVSFDGGQTWNQINDGLLGATVVYSIAVDKDSNVYAATPYGIFKLEGK